MATYCVLRHYRSKRYVLPVSLSERVFPSFLPSWLGLTQAPFHTATRCPVDHTKEKAIVKHLNYVDHEKSLGHAYTSPVSLPDYTYQDGRPTELTVCYKRRQEKNYNMAKRVVQLVGEVKLAQHQLKDQMDTERRDHQARRTAQLKQKGGL